MTCYAAGRRCLNQDHALSLKDPYGQGTYQCRRLLEYEGVVCDRAQCRKPVEGLYFRSWPFLRSKKSFC